MRDDQNSTSVEIEPNTTSRSQNVINDENEDALLQAAVEQEDFLSE